ncbi:MAG: hypothetical protein U0744_06905 [Gemmataceae bacterium]
MTKKSESNLRKTVAPRRPAMASPSLLGKGPGASFHPLTDWSAEIENLLNTFA